MLVQARNVETTGTQENERQNCREPIIRVPEHCSINFFLILRSRTVVVHRNVHHTRESQRNTLSSALTETRISILVSSRPTSTAHVFYAISESAFRVPGKMINRSDRLINRCGFIRGATGDRRLCWEFSRNSPPTPERSSCYEF